VFSYVIVFRFVLTLYKSLNLLNERFFALISCSCDRKFGTKACRQAANEVKRHAMPTPTVYVITHVESMEVEDRRRRSFRVLARIHRVETRLCLTVVQQWYSVAAHLHLPITCRLDSKQCRTALSIVLCLSVGAYISTIRPGPFACIGA